MNKSDLKSGMVVELRNGEKFIVIEDKIYSKDSDFDLTIYNENLTVKSKYKVFDIVKVYKVKYNSLLRGFLNNDLEILWRRDEDKWKLIKKDTKVLVRNSMYDDWERRYFSMYIPAYQDAPFFTYPEGKDSWSAYSHIRQSTPNVQWKYCKLAEDKDEE